MFIYVCICFIAIYLFSDFLFAVTQQATSGPKNSVYVIGGVSGGSVLLLLGVILVVVYYVIRYDY